MHYLLFYDFVSDYVERRAAFRVQHLKLAWEAQARGELILAGALNIHGTLRRVCYVRR
jgi:hypothetical protein